MLWTLLIFFLCLLPGNDLPDVHIPFIDKWAHIVLFGVFSFLWLCSTVVHSLRFYAIVFAITLFLGWLVEYIQGHYIPGRSQDTMDILADSLGGICGIALFAGFYVFYNRPKTPLE